MSFLGAIRPLSCGRQFRPVSARWVPENPHCARSGKQQTLTVSDYEIVLVSKSSHGALWHPAVGLTAAIGPTAHSVVTADGYAGPAGGVPPPLSYKFVILVPHRFLRELGIDLSRTEILMSEQLLDHGNIHARVQRMRSEGVPQQVRVYLV